ncbi:MAG: RICIN domain-containing protein [Chitinophagaceae bacterium]
MKKFAAFLIAMVCISGSNLLHAQVISGTYAIKNMQTGMLLRIKDANTANGTPLVSYNPVNWKCMTWDFQHKDGDNYQLKNLFSGKTFQPRQDAADGVAMEEQPLQNGDASQQYEFIAAGKNVYYIRLKGTDLYLTPADEKGRTNSAIVLQKKVASPLQQWTIYEQHPEF